MKFDLEDRTAKFGEMIIKFCRTIPDTTLTHPLNVQLIKCSSSIGANYAEADDTESKDDFRHKIAISKKEARETKHFLRLLAAANPESRSKIVPLWQEAKELNLILNTIYRRVKFPNN